MRKAKCYDLLVNQLQFNISERKGFHMGFEKQVVETYRRWENADQAVIATNIVSKLNDMGENTYELRVDALMKCTNTNRDAVCAWLNTSRENVKVPFIKLCMIADYMKVDIIKLMEGHFVGKYEEKFVITRVVGDKEKFLKYFGINEKEAALAYGEEISKTNTEGVIACYTAMFNKRGRMHGGNMRVYKVWNVKQ